MTYKRIFPWLTLDMIIFVLLNAFLIYYLRHRFFVLSGIGYFELLVFSLAVFRAANIISNEVVTKPLRAPFVDEVKHHDHIEEQPKKSGFSGAVGLLIYCPSCTGVWIAAAFIYSFIFWPGPTYVVALLFAFSGIERIISAILVHLKKS